MAKAERDMYVGKNGISHLADSRKGKLHRIFDEQGVDAMVKSGREMGLSESTIRTCLNRWGGAKQAVATLGKAPKIVKKAGAPAGDHADASLQDFRVNYMYTTEARANAAADAVAKRNGYMRSCLDVIGQMGRWGVIPRHMDARVTLPKFENDMQVRSMMFPHLVGVVREVTQDDVAVAWDDGTSTRSSPYYLLIMPRHEPEVVAAAKRKKVVKTKGVKPEPAVTPKALVAAEIDKTKKSITAKKTAKKAAPKKGAKKAAKKSKAKAA